MLLASPGGDGHAPLHRGVMLWDGPPGCFWGCWWGWAVPQEVTDGISGLLQAASDCGSGSSSCSPEWSSQLEFGTNPAGNALLASLGHPTASLGSAGSGNSGNTAGLEPSITEPTPSQGRRRLEQRAEGTLPFSPHPTDAE